MTDNADRAHRDRSIRFNAAKIRAMRQRALTPYKLTPRKTDVIIDRIHQRLAAEHGLAWRGDVIGLAVKGGG